MIGKHIIYEYFVFSLKFCAYDICLIPLVIVNGINFCASFQEWSWTQKSEWGGKYKINSSANIAILLNSAMTSRGDKVNIMPESSSSKRFYALVDIDKDEELLTDYKAYDTVWKEVGL